MREIINTPGYYYSIAYILAAFIVTCTNRHRIAGGRRYAAHLVFFAALYSFMQLTDGVRQVFFLPAMMASVTLILCIHAVSLPYRKRDTTARERLSAESLRLRCVGRSISIPATP